MIFLSPFVDVISVSMSTDSFFAQLDSGNSLPIECFCLTYDTNGFKYKINGNLLSLGSVYIDFLYDLIFLYFFFAAS